MMKKRVKHYNDSNVAISRIVQQLYAFLMLLSPIISASLSVRAKLHLGGRCPPISK